MSQYFYCEQRSDEWYALRAGVATASNFDCIITPTGQPVKSEKSKAYMYKLISCLVLGMDEAAMVVPTGPMQRGMIMENEACDYYALVNSSPDMEKVGFILSDNKMYGASPDRLIGKDGLLEIKCPNASTHIGYILNEEIDKQYWPQVQGQLLLAEREWSDWMSYHDYIRPIIVRTYRDEEYISKLQEALTIFSDNYMEAVNKLISKGIIEKTVLEKFK